MDPTPSWSAEPQNPFGAAALASSGATLSARQPFGRWKHIVA
jgi:hypothetical protein